MGDDMRRHASTNGCADAYDEILSNGDIDITNGMGSYRTVQPEFGKHTHAHAHIARRHARKRHEINTSNHVPLGLNHPGPRKRTILHRDNPIGTVDDQSDGIDIDIDIGMNMDMDDGIDTDTTKRRKVEHNTGTTTRARTIPVQYTQWEAPAPPSAASTGNGLGFLDKIPVDAATGNVCITETAPVVEDLYLDDMDLCQTTEREFREDSRKYEEAAKRVWARREYERKMNDGKGGGVGVQSAGVQYRNLVASIVSNADRAMPTAMSDPEWPVTGTTANARKQRSDSEDASDASSSSTSPVSPARSQTSRTSRSSAEMNTRSCDIGQDADALAYRTGLEQRYGFSFENTELATDDQHIVAYIPTKCHGCYAHAGATQTLLVEIDTMIRKMYLKNDIDALCNIIARGYAESMKDSGDDSVLYMTPEKWKEHMADHMNLPGITIALEIAKLKKIIELVGSNLFIVSRDGSAPKPNARMLKEYRELLQTQTTLQRTLAVFQKDAERKIDQTDPNKMMMFLSRFTPQSDPVSKLHLIADGLKPRNNDFNSYSRRK